MTRTLNRNRRRLPVVLCAAAAFTAGCKEENSYQPPPPPAVTVANPTQQDVTEYVEFTGRTESVDVVEVRARVQGVIEAIHSKEGMQVEVGTPLFSIDPRPFIAARDAAAAELKSAEANAALELTRAERTERSAREDAVSEMQALEARAKANVAAANVLVAEETLAMKQLDVDYASVTAPITGYVGQTNFKVGSLVGTADASLLTTMYRRDQIHVWFSVPDRLLLERKASGRADDDALFPDVELATEVDDGFPYRGRVDYGDPAVDPTTGTLQVRAIFENADESLVGGLFVRCRIAVGETIGATMVPETAVSIDQSGKYVLVVGDSNIVERRSVEIGPTRGGLVVIRAGLDPSERIVVRGLLRARPGAPVSPQDVDA